jgi:hypothetical protein
MRKPVGSRVIEVGPVHYLMFSFARISGQSGDSMHRRYTSFINVRGRRTGHLFQNRFAPVAMDESHLRSAVSYVSLNPVRARIVSRAEDWVWASVRAHLAGEDDSLVSVRPVLDRWPNFRDLLLEDWEKDFTTTYSSSACSSARRAVVAPNPHGILSTFPSLTVEVRSRPWTR